MAQVEAPDPQRDFDALVNDWQMIAARMAAAELAYTQALASALLKATGKNEAARQAEAETSCFEQRGERDSRRISEQAQRWRVQWHLARAGRSKFDGG
jgi:hypothetical protein